MIKHPLPTRPDEGAARWRSRRLLPAAAAGALFIGAFGLGMATKSSSSPQTATSLASPVQVQASPVTVPALQRDVQTPALKPRATPASRKPAPKTTVTTPAVSSPGPSLSPTSPPAPQSPPARVIHGQSGSVVHSSGGGGSVVHGGN